MSARRPDSSILTTQNPASHSIGLNVLTQCVSSHVLSGLCKIAGYEILRHGSSWANYKSILRSGADPRRGGTTTDQSEGRYEIGTHYTTLADGSVKITETKTLKTKISPSAKGSRNHFYVFRDSFLGIGKNGKRTYPWILSTIGKRFGPVIHSYNAYVAEYEKTSKEEAGTLKRIAAFAKGFFTPKIKFIYSLDEVNGDNGKNGLFENDPEYGEEAAYRTSQPLPADRIGLLGLLAHANKKHVIEHVKAHPGRVILGIIQLSCGILFTAVPGLGVIT